MKGMAELRATHPFSLRVIGSLQLVLVDHPAGLVPGRSSTRVVDESLHRPELRFSPVVENESVFSGRLVVAELSGSVGSGSVGVLFGAFVKEVRDSVFQLQLICIRGTWSV